MKHVISTTTAPGAVGPYSQAIEANGFVFVSGQLPLDPATGAFVPGGTSEQAEQSIKNLLAVLEAAGCKAEDVVKTTVFMIDIGDFGVVNEVYGKYFSGECPARCAMQAAALPKGALVEIDPDNTEIQEKEKLLNMVCNFVKSRKRNTLMEF